MFVRVTETLDFRTVAGTSKKNNSARHKQPMRSKRRYNRLKECRSGGASRRDFLARIAILGAGLMTQTGIAAIAQGHNAPPEKGAETNKAQVPEDPHNAPMQGMKPAAPRVDGRLHVNQVGYLPGEAKRAVISAANAVTGTDFCVLDDDVTPHIHFRGQLTRYTGPVSADDGALNYYLAELDGFNRPGRYRLRLADGSLSAPFSIGSDLYARLVPLIWRYFDVQRCGATDPEAHGPCHRDDGILIGGPRNGQPFDASGGWHDAGDYLKFVETTSYVTALMLFAHARFPLVFAERDPQTRLPQILAQAKVGLDWLLKMHPSPQEFYYQVGDAGDHETWRLPENDCAACNKAWKPRSVYYGVGANLAGRTAAAFALAAQQFRRFDRRFAARCLEAAQSVYTLGLQNRHILTTQPDDYYPEQTWEDDMAWGAAELYKATGRQEFLDQALEFAHSAGPCGDGTSVYNTHAVAYATLLPHVPERDRERLRDYLRQDAETIRTQAENPYGLGTRYGWGTSEMATGAALTCLLYAGAAHGTDTSAYTAAARRQRDFILGCNPFGLCCLIGAGTRYALFPHHQIANLKGIELRGALIGGPASLHALRGEKMSLDGVEISSQLSGDADADDLPDGTGVYRDVVENYVTNEPANDYTVKFLLLSAFYQHTLETKEIKEI